jgi:hypothetical protein
MRYNTEDENLSLWKCHPERVCINCRYFWGHRPDKWTQIYLACTNINEHWKLGFDWSKEDFISNLLTARKCKDFKLYVVH